jgi:hypothetical protein
MSAVATLKAARAVGIELALDGEDLVLCLASGAYGRRQCGAASNGH